MNNLIKFGWNKYFENEFKSSKEQGFIPARIAVENKERYLIYTNRGIFPAEVTGRLLYSAASPADLPKVGDWVSILFFGDEKKGIIHNILKRKTKISRKSADRKTEEQIIAANIDKSFIVQSLDSNFNLQRLERYITMSIEGGVQPVIILNKIDLVQNPNKFKIAVDAIAGDFKIILTGALSGEGIQKISSSISEGETVVLIGSSGVGKSTIINKLIGEEVQKTQRLSGYAGKGKHTTTKREMILLPSGGILIDTPGMRELAVWKSESGFDETFSDIEELSRKCKFKDCRHETETGCAILQAISSGSLDERRLMNYKKLQKELFYLYERDAALTSKKEWEKQIKKEIKQLYKRSDKY